MGNKTANFLHLPKGLLFTSLRRKARRTNVQDVCKALDSVCRGLVLAPPFLSEFVHSSPHCLRSVHERRLHRCVQCVLREPCAHVETGYTHMVKNTQGDIPLTLPSKALDSADTPDTPSWTAALNFVCCLCMSCSFSRTCESCAATSFVRASILSCTARSAAARLRSTSPVSLEISSRSPFSTRLTRVLVDARDGETCEVVGLSDMYHDAIKSDARPRSMQ